MTAWRCLVVSREGLTNWKTIEAGDRGQAVARLVAEGLTPLDVRTGAASLTEILNRPVRLSGHRLGLAEQSLLLTQLAMLVRSGLPVDRSLDLLRDQAGRAVQRGIIAEMLSRVRSGGSLASAIEAANSFPAYVAGVIRAAERSGRLGDALTAVAARIATTATTRRQLVTALTYPAAVLAATIIALVLVLTAVVPQFEPVFAGEEARLPTVTRLVLGLSRTVIDHGAMLGLAGIGIPFAVWLFLRSGSGAALIERHRERLPGLALRDQYLSAQVMGIFATLVSNGVSVVTALPLVRGAVGSRRWRHHLETVERQVREGMRLSAALDRGQLLPSTALRLIEVGERSGRLAETCAQASAIIADAARARIERVVALANPIAIITLGSLVGMLVAGVMLGIFALGDFAG